MSPLLTERLESTFQVIYSTLIVLGYGGYLTGVKAENVFGQTYGKTSYQSTANQIERGIDQAPHLKYNSTFRSEFIKHSDKQHETTA